MSSNYSYSIKLLLAILTFLFALIINYHASYYAAEVGRTGCSVGDDLLLNWLPYYNLSGLFAWGFAGFILTVIIACIFFERPYIPYILWMYALLIVIRSFFIVLTPLNMPPDDSSFFDYDNYLYTTLGVYLTSHYDLFFSSHTSMPFLGFLIIKNKIARIILLILSFVLAATVLLARYHYSIDVFAAYFITYGFFQAHRNFIEPWFLKINNFPVSSGKPSSRT